MSNLDSLKQKVDLKLTLPVSYYFKEAKRPTNKTVLLLHGYQDSASSLMKRVFAVDENIEEQDFDFNILAPNGIYPVPVRTEQGFREAYAWYFVDGARNITLVAPEVASAGIYSLLKHLGMETDTFHIVGFSQGGILASFVAHQLENVTGILGVGTLFFPEYYAGLKVTLPVDAIHGVDDDVITLQTSQKGYQELKALQPRPGEYYQFKKLKHTLDDAARSKVKELIELRLLNQTAK